MEIKAYQVAKLKPQKFEKLINLVFNPLLSLIVVASNY